MTGQRIARTLCKGISKPEKCDLEREYRHFFLHPGVFLRSPEKPAVGPACIVDKVPDVLTKVLVIT